MTGAAHCISRSLDPGPTREGMFTRPSNAALMTENQRALPVFWKRP
jgi:hypothetical protein